MFLEEFTFARDVAAVALGDHVLANGRDSFAGDHAIANRGLDRNFKHLARNQLAQARDEILAAFVGELTVADQRERVHGLPCHQHIQLYVVRFRISRQVIIERCVAARGAFQPIVEVENDFVERKFVGEHDALRRQILEIFLNAAFFLTELQDGADGILRGDNHGGDDRLFDFGHLIRRGKFRGAVHLDDGSICGRDPVADAGRGGDEVDTEFALQSLLHDLHMQQAEESAAKSEAERDGIFRLVEEGGVIQLKFAQRIAQIFVIAGQNGKQAGEHHRLDRFKSGQGRSGARRIDHSVAHAGIGYAFDIGDDEAHVSGDEFLEHHRFRRQRPKRFDFVNFIVEAQPDLHVTRDPAVHDPHQHNGTAKGIEPGVKDERLERRFGCSDRSGDTRYHSLQHRFHADTALGADQQGVRGGNCQHVFDLRLHLVGLRGRKIDLVDHRNDSEIMLRREERVRNGLRFDALAGVNDQQRAFTGRKRAGDFVGKIDVAGRVDQIELIVVSVFRLVVQANALGLDGDAALAFQVHGVQDLRAHFALAERTCKFEKAVGQRGLAVVNMRDDAKITDEAWIHQLARRRKTYCAGEILLKLAARRKA